MRRAEIFVGMALVICLALVGREFLQRDRAAAGPTVEQVQRSIPSTAVRTEAQRAPGDPLTAQPSTRAGVGVLRGRVVDAATNEPITTVEISLREASSTSRTFSDPEGRFEWADIPAGAWAASVKAPGYQSFDIDRVTIEAGAPTPEILVPLRRGAVLRGRVYDERTGVGLGGARLAVREAHLADMERDFGVRESAETDSGGFFRLTGAPTGRVVLRAWAPGFAPEEVHLHADGETEELEIALSVGAKIAGRLVAADQTTPLQGKVVVFSRSAMHGAITVLSTTREGGFEIAQLAAGRYRLLAQADGKTVEQDVVLAKNEQRADVLLVLESPGAARIRGLVTGLSQEDLAQVRIRAVLREERLLAQVNLDSGGTFVLHEMPAGAIKVSAELKNRRQVHKIVDTPASGETTVTLRFDEGSRLSGRITRGGRPVAQTSVMPFALFDADSYVYGVKTNDNGEYIVTGLADGDYRLMIQSYRSKRFRVSGDTTLNVDIPASDLIGRILDSQSRAPVARSNVHLWFASAEQGSWRRSTTANDFGEFSFDALEPGEYALSVYRYGYGLWRERVRLDAGSQPLTILLREDPGVEIVVKPSTGDRPLEEVFAREGSGANVGLALRLPIDPTGTTYLPRAFSGGAVQFAAPGYSLRTIPSWSGERITVLLEPE